MHAGRGLPGMFRPAVPILLAILLLATASECLGRPKTDVVVLGNGDRVTGEIKQLARGKLKVKTDDMGTVEIEWDKIASLEGNYYFRVETSDGRRLFGALHLEQGDSLTVVGGRVRTRLPKLRAVEITPIEASFWSRFDGSLSFGFSYTKASNVAQVTFDWTNLYRTERNLIDLKAKTIITDKGAENRTARNIDVKLGYNRLLRRKWTGNVSGLFQRNDELALKRRTLLSVGTGANPIKSNRSLLLATLGIAVSSEVAKDSTQSRESLEGVLTTSYSLFHYDSPKTEISTSITWFPSFTQSGRHRIDADLKLRRELLSDLFFDISLYVAYDSRAVSDEGEKDDFGVVTSLGWSY